MQDPNFWLGRWERGETGWHQTEVEPRLIENFSGLQPTSVFVPLCGKSLDLVWLHQQGHEVLGVELSERACREFFDEQGLTPAVTVVGPLKLFSCERYRLFQGDFFKLTPELLGPVGAVYDRAALIALPPDLRPQYARHMKTLLSAPSLRFLQIILERSPHDVTGPPHSILESEVESLYGDGFKVEWLSRETLPDRSPSGASVTEKVARLDPLPLSGSVSPHPR
jgi:thiopurine S-methyltransferase